MRPQLSVFALFALVFAAGVAGASTVTVTSSPNPAAYGQRVTITATVTPSTATGKVSFYDGAMLLGTGTLSGGQATLVTALLASGSRTLTALYNGVTGTSSTTQSQGHLQRMNPVASTGTLPRSSFAAGLNPQIIAAADFNLDGKQDLVTSSSADTVSVLLGNGDGTFQAPRNYTVHVGTSAPSIITAIAVGDINGDGNADLAVASATGGVDNGVVVLLGNGDGTFQTAATVAGTQPQSGTTPVAAGLVLNDLNGDGNADLIYLTSLGMIVLLGNGDGTFQAPLTDATTGYQPGSWAFTDFNNDGKIDLVSTGLGSGVYVRLGNGNGTFQATVQYPSSLSNLDAVAVGDFNGDGNADVVEMFQSGAVMTLLGNGDGTLQTGVIAGAFISGTPGYVTVGDFNGDGKLDLAFRLTGDVNITILFGNGDGTLQAPVSISAGGGVGGIVLGEFNGNGTADFAAATGANNAVAVYLGANPSGLNITSTHTGVFTAGSSGAYQLTVVNPLFALPTGTITVTDTLPAGLSATSMSGTGWTCTLGTLTCTRADDPASGNTYPPINLVVSVASNLTPSTVVNQVSVSYATVVNSATDQTSIVYPSTTVLAVSPQTATLGQLVTLTATITGSGSATGLVSFTDSGLYLGSGTVASGQAALATTRLTVGVHLLTAKYAGDANHSASSSTVQLTVMASAANGLSSAVPYTTGAGPAQLITADFNGDGKPDLLTVNTPANTVSVLLGNGDGTFQAKQDFAVGSQPVWAVVGDFSGDGFTDIITANQGDNTLSVLLGRGNGTLQTAVSIPLGRSPLAMVAGDVNQDGKADLIVAFRGELRVLLGTGSGTFTTANSTVGPNQATRLILTDFNGDSKPDLALQSTTGIWIELGNGDGTFQSPLNPTSAAGVALAAADLNGDGVPDLVTTDSRGGINVLLCQSTGSCASAVYYATGPAVADVAIADFNGDGKLDVVAVNSGNNTISVLPGKGDGTFLAQSSYSTSSTPVSVAIGDFNGDGRTDLAVANSQSNNVTIVLGTLLPALGVSSTHTGNFLFNQTGAVYTLTVTNLGPPAFTGAVTVVDTLPSGLTATSIAGSGWTCTLATLTCTSSGTLAMGASMPVITVTVTVNLATTSTVTNTVTVSSPAAISGSGSDLTNVTAIAPPALVSPSNGTTGVSLTALLSWNPVKGATTYQVYLGTSSTPPLVYTTAGVSFTGGALVRGTTYYWRIVAQSAAGGASSAIYSFVTSGAQYTGAFESASCQTFSGWAADRLRLNQSINVSIYDSSTLLATIAANQSRPDIAALLGDNGLHGFTYTVPASISNGNPHTIIIYYDTTSQELPSSKSLICGSVGQVTNLGLAYYPVTPCRVADTRVPAGFSGQFGPPAMSGGQTRTFDILASSCGQSIPAGVAAYALNFTVVPPSTGPPANLTTWASGSMPNVSTLNYSGFVVANAAIVPASTSGSINVFVNYPTDVLFDIMGYFAPPLTTPGLEFYPLTPCRIADTRVPAGFSGQFGPPALAAGATRTFNLGASSCGIPSTAAAFSLNFTVVPPSNGPWANLTTWPTGAASMPNVSTLNFSDFVVANAAIVPAGTNESINLFANYRTDALFDIDGYFAPPSTNGLHFYPVTPCRVADTRPPAGFSGQFGPPTMTGGSTRTFNIPASSCGIPVTAVAYSLNFTVVPPSGGPAANLTTWPAGSVMPNVSTLNYYGNVVANAAIVPAGTNGAINVFVNFTTDVLFDINGYFAP